MAVLRGAKEMRATLKKVRSGGQNAARTAAMAGARYLRVAERRAVPRDSGHGAKTIIAKRERSRPGEGIASVKVTKAGFYLHILEVGAKGHRIAVNLVHRIIDRASRKVIGKAKGRRALAIGLGFGQGHGLLVFRRAVHHPGVRARHWFRSTYEREKPMILDKVRESYTEQLAKQVEKKGL